MIDSDRFTPAALEIESVKLILILIDSHQLPLMISSVNDIDSDRFTPAALDVSSVSAVS